VARTILAPSIGTLEKQGASFSWLSQLEGRDDRAIEYSQKFELKETLYSKEAPPAPTDIFHSKIDLSTGFIPTPSTSQLTISDALDWPLCPITRLLRTKVNSQCIY
ncbi:hypothetical protein J6590_098640, partial [Homalodisca vitripennis]